MKATPKPECVGHTHPIYGLLVAGVVYEVEEIHPDGPFQPVSEAKPKKAKPAEEN